MRFAGVVTILAAVLPLTAHAQCFNRFQCTDPGTLEIRSQINVNIPIAEHASTSDALKAMEDARRDLYALSNRECDTLKSTFGGECTLTAINLNSAIQDRGSRNNSAYVSVSNTYQVKRTAKQ